MDLPIEVFEIMAGIAEENKVKSVKWVRASGLSASRISDFKKLAKKTSAGAAEPAGEREVTGHIFSLNNFLTLWDGLKRLVGTTALRKGLIKQLETKKVSTRVRVFMRRQRQASGCCVSPPSSASGGFLFVPDQLQEVQARKLL